MMKATMANEKKTAPWCEDLEDLLQCPVCFERLKGIVVQCERGHHICSQCKIHMTECPMCKCQFRGTRSYLAEELSSKLDDIKLSLINPQHVIVKKVSVSTQTDVKNSVQESNEVKQVNRVAPKPAKGKFPCRIGNCDVTLPHGRMIPHIRYYHRSRFNETYSTDGGNSYVQAWNVDYYCGAVFDIAIRIAEMGLFFLNIFVDNSGSVYGILQIVNSNFIGKEFTYKLEVKGEQRCSSYTGQVMCCRIAPETLYALDCLHINHDDMFRMTTNSDVFTCVLTITRKPGRGTGNQNRSHS